MVHESAGPIAIMTSFVGTLLIEILHRNKGNVVKFLARGEY